MILSDEDSFLRRVGIHFYSYNRTGIVPTPRIWKRISELSESDEDSYVKFIAKDFIGKKGPSSAEFEATNPIE